jgi:N,N'-diacetyllegionaminate synthase
VTIRIASHNLAERVLVVAEIGNNHEGDMQLAKEMIGAAADAGADVVKFQTIEPELLVGPEQRERLEQLERFRLPPGSWEQLSRVARGAGVEFMSTPFHLGAVAELDPLVPAFKVASGDNDFPDLLRAVASTAKPILLSTGLTNLAKVERSVALIQSVWDGLGVAPGLVLLHCVVCYPTAPEEANLRAIRTLEALGHTLGYSDHTVGVSAAPLAVALGARVVEKHFTLSKTFSEFRDHALSADPPEMRELVDRIREAESLLGSGQKAVAPCEAAALPVVRRSAAAARHLPAGHRLAVEDIVWLRGIGGVRPAQGSQELVGRTIRNERRAGEPLRDEDLA